MRATASALSVAAAAALIMVGGATAAHAGKDMSSTIEGSYTEFISKGDKFYNCDTDFDFFQAYVDYSYIRKNGTLQTGQHYNPGNEGDCATWTHNFGEGRRVQFRSCVDVIAGNDLCDRWREGIA